MNKHQEKAAQLSTMVQEKLNHGQQVMLRELMAQMRKVVLPYGNILGSIALTMVAAELMKEQ